MFHNAINWEYDNSNDAMAGESSKTGKDEDELSDDPFDGVISKNAMPKLPSAKKEFLEDYENFTVK